MSRVKASVFGEAIVASTMSSAAWMPSSRSSCAAAWTSAREGLVAARDGGDRPAVAEELVGDGAAQVAGAEDDGGGHRRIIGAAIAGAGKPRPRLEALLDLGGALVVAHRRRAGALGALRRDRRMLVGLGGHRLVALGLATEALGLMAVLARLLLVDLGGVRRLPRAQ